MESKTDIESKKDNIKLIRVSNNRYEELGRNRKNRLYYFLIIIGILFIIILTIKIYFSKSLKIGKTISCLFPNTTKLQNKKLTLSDKLKLLKLYTNNNELRYKGIEKCLTSDPDTQKCIYHLIVPKNVLGKKRILLGNKKDGDGIYVILDDLKDIKIAYSFGISRNIQFDKALADRGIDVYMYDHTINRLPYENPRFHWKKIGISGKKTSYNLKDLDTLIIENNHISEKNMILKLDVEHWEWPAINDLDEATLKKFKYILVEYHFYGESNPEYKIYYNVMKKLSKNHQSFYARCNGDRSKIIKFGNNRICHIMEVCYVIKENNKFTFDDTIYPIDEFEYIKQKINGKLEMNLNILKLFDLDV